MNWKDELKDKFDWMQNQDYFLLEDLIESLLKKQRKKIIKEQKELCWRNASVLCEYNKNVLEVYVDRGSILNAPEPGEE